MGDSVRASHLLVKHSGSRRPASWRDPDGKAFILAKSKAAALAELAALRARIVAGEDFAALAKQYSDCGSASAGGDLGVFGRCVAPFAQRKAGVALRARSACADARRAAARCRRRSRTAPSRSKWESCRRVRATQRSEPWCSGCAFRFRSPLSFASAMRCRLTTPHASARSGGHRQRGAHHPAHRLNEGARRPYVYQLAVRMSAGWPVLRSAERVLRCVLRARALDTSLSRAGESSAVSDSQAQSRSARAPPRRRRARRRTGGVRIGVPLLCTRARRRRRVPTPAGQAGCSAARAAAARLA